MEHAFILIETQLGCADEVARGISSKFGALVVERVSGAYDVVVRAEAPTIEAIRSALVAPIQADPKVTRALLCPIGHVASAEPQPIEPEPFAIRDPEPALAGVVARGT